MQNKRTLRPHEVFYLVNKARTVDERVEILKANSSFALKTILQVAFSQSITLNLPEGAPPYTPAKAEAVDVNRAITILKMLVPKLTGIKQIKQEHKFIMLLESVSAEDAKVLIAMKDRVISRTYRGMSESTINKAFPNLIKT